MKSVISDEDIEMNVDYLKSGEYDKMNENLQHIGIIISYDMGWKNVPPGVFMTLSPDMVSLLDVCPRM